jgi:hypothetical protein
MKISTIARIIFPLLLILVAGLLWACGSEAPIAKPPLSDKPSPPTVVVTPPAPDKPSAPANRVDIVYFHPKIRCGACISVELRVRDSINNYFKDETASGKLTFQTYELQDKKNAIIVKKYGAMSSQLFITTVKNGVENIKHVEEVWMPQILNDGPAFDEFMQKLIRQKLGEVA